MADVFRGKSKALSAQILPAYAFHGVTAVLTLFLLFKALEG